LTNSLHTWYIVFYLNKLIFQRKQLKGAADGT
jgi:hypothetical protein